MLACGKHKEISECWREMESYQHPNRDQNEHVPFKEITATRCPFLVLKKLIINMRRGKERDFSFFRHFIEENLEFWLEKLDIRWIVSLCDSYIDYGTPTQKAQAAIIVAFVNTEKANYMCRLDPNSNEPYLTPRSHWEKLQSEVKAIEHAPPAWVVCDNGLFYAKVRHLNHDFYDNFIRRMRAALTEPLFRAMFEAVWKKFQTSRYFSYKQL